MTDENIKRRRVLHAKDCKTRGDAFRIIFRIDADPMCCTSEKEFPVCCMVCFSMEQLEQLRGGDQARENALAMIFWPELRKAILGALGRIELPGFPKGEDDDS